MSKQSNQPGESPSLSEGTYRELFQASADAILIIKDDVFIDCNSAAVDMMGYTDKASLLQAHPSDLSPEYQPDGQTSFDKANAMMSQARDAVNQRFEWVHTKENGETFPAEVLLTAVQPADGGDAIIHAVVRDISERKLLETELRHSQKMDVVGKLASGVAHDFNNQLVPILGYSDLLVNALADQPQLGEWALEIHRASTYATTLVNKLLAFSRKEASKPVVLDVCVVVQELSGILRKLVGENVTVEFTIPRQALWIRADAGDVEQILLNLSTNARDALPDGGCLRVELSRVETAEDHQICLCVADNGFGMDAKTSQKIFDPFFTTKALGNGTGLGMATVNDLVADAGGSIDVKSAPDRGTTIQVFLPEVTAQDVQSSQPRQHAVEKAAVSNHSHILVVEDDPQITLFIERVLGAHGYTVTTKSNGADALQYVTGNTPDLVLTDVIMAKMNGPVMAQQMLARGICIPVVFMSGYTDDRLQVSGFDPDSVTLVRKPFTASKLLAQIRSALPGQRGDRVVH